MHLHRQYYLVFTVSAMVFGSGVRPQANTRHQGQMPGQILQTPAKFIWQTPPENSPGKPEGEIFTQLCKFPKHLAGSPSSPGECNTSLGPISVSFIPKIMVHIFRL